MTTKRLAILALISHFGPLAAAGEPEDSPPTDPAVQPPPVEPAEPAAEAAPVPVPEPPPPSPAPVPDGPPRLVALLHPSVDPGKELTDKELRRIYLGQRQVWRPGQAITPIRLRETSDASTALFDDVLKMNSSRFAATWQQLELSGRGVAPRRVESVEEMIATVAGTPGAIGYAMSSDVPVGAPVTVVELSAE